MQIQKQNTATGTNTQPFTWPHFDKKRTYISTFNTNSLEPNKENDVPNMKICIVLEEARKGR